MTPGNMPKSAGEMLADVLGNVSNLVRNEVDLARTEVAEGAKNAVSAALTLLIAVVIAITGFNLLSLALVQVVVWAGVAPHWAPLVVGGALVLIAGVMAAQAVSKLKLIGFVPARAARNLKRDAAAVKEAYNDK